jgi:hypothetical protein
MFRRIGNRLDPGRAWLGDRIEYPSGPKIEIIVTAFGIRGQAFSPSRFLIGITEDVRPAGNDLDRDFLVWKFLAKPPVNFRLHIENRTGIAVRVFPHYRLGPSSFENWPLHRNMDWMTSAKA